MAGTRRTYVKRISIGRPIASINEAASGVVSASARSAGQILINDASTNLYQSGDLLGGYGLNKTFNSASRTITLALDSDDIKNIIDSNYVSFVLGQQTNRNFVDSAYVEANSLDSERSRNLTDADNLAIRTSLIPNTDSAYDLGSATNKWRKLYLSGNTIVLGGLNIGDEGGTFAVRDSSGSVAAYDLSGNTTTDLGEGTNLYYTRARFDSALGDNTSISTIRGYINVVDAGGDGSFTYDSSLGKITYTGPSAAEVRAHFQAIDAGGDGSFSYDSSTGNFTYTGPSASEVRAHFSAQGDLTYDSSTGVFSFDVEQVYTQANFESDLSQSVAGGTGITYDSATQTISITNTGVIAGEYGSQTQVPIITVNAQGQIDSIGEILVAGVTGFSLDSTSGVLTITTADGGSFSAPIHSRDSALLTDISGNTLNYATINATTGTISQLSIDSAHIGIIDNNTLRTNSLDADSAVITDISGTTANYPTIISSQLSADSAAITTIDNNVLRTNDLNADSAVITDISGTTLNYGTGNFTSATAAGLTVNGVSNLDSTNIDGSLYVSGNLTVQGTTTTVNSTTVSLNDKNLVLGDSAASLAELDGAGITMGGASIGTPPEMKYVTTGDLINFNRAVDIDGHINADSATFVNLNVTDLATTTISRAATVDSGTYGSATLIPVITVNTSGFIDSIGEIAVAGVSGVSWDSSVEQLTINTADGGSFVTTINGFDSAQITNVSGTTLNYAQVLSDSAIITDISGTSLNYDTGLISQLTVDSGTFTTLAINGRTIDSDWVQSFAKNFEGDITITTTQDDAAVGPTLTLYRNSASPADSDLIGQIVFKAQDDSGNAQEFAKIRGVIKDASGDSEYGSIETYVIENGFYVPVTRQSASGFEILNNIPLSLNGSIVYDGSVVDSSWVGERARTITAAEIKYINIDGGAGNGPRLILDRNSVSPADSDAIGYFEFRGRNSSDSEVEYGSIRSFITTATADAEDAEIKFHLKQAGFDREKIALTRRGVELGTNERLYFQNDSGDGYLHWDPTGSQNLLLPDSTGTLLTVGHMFNLIDSAYVGARQGATGQTLNFKDRDSNLYGLTVIESVAFTGGIVSLGNTVTLLDEDSAEVIVSL